MAVAAEPLVEEKNAPTQRPDRDGRFGRFGGKYVSSSHFCPQRFQNVPVERSCLGLMPVQYQACSRDGFTGT